uniref:U26-Deinotoxin-Dsu1a_1 n=1 Tax=Deinopis subrufa TaxID=1905329 RepID=A0A4Q8K9D2_DEISU
MNFHIPLLLLASVLVILVIAESTHLEAENLGDYSLEASERACRRVRQPCDKKKKCCESFRCRCHKKFDSCFCVRKAKKLI